MQVVFSRHFSKDLDRLQVKVVKEMLLEPILNVEEAENLDAISNVKSLKGSKNAYRIRLGDYRLGFFLEGTEVILGRFLHRKDIYRFFP